MYEEGTFFFILKMKVLTVGFGNDYLLRWIHQTAVGCFSYACLGRKNKKIKNKKKISSFSTLLMDALMVFFSSTV